MRRPAAFTGPDGPFRGTVMVPGDKSSSHRALLLAAMATGQSRLSNLAPGLDVASTAAALRALGVPVEGERFGAAGGTRAWTAASAPLDCGNSGTTMRLLAGAVAAMPFDTVLIGDDSLMRRPMDRLVAPLGALGASITTEGGFPPVHVSGRTLSGADVWVPVPSAQVRTAVALAALQADGPTVLDSPPGYRDHTERWLEALGRGRGLGGSAFEVLPGPVPPLDIAIPGDPSSAAFLWAATAISSGSAVTTPTVSLNPGRIGFLEVLRRMGASVSWTVTGDVLGDPVGDVAVGHGPLRGVTVSGPEVAACIDELPLVGLVAAFADGRTEIADAAELRTKESDRIAATVALVTGVGGDAAETPHGFVVSGGRPRGGRVDAGGDHRIAMAGAVAASAGGRVEVEGFGASAVSWPGFDRVLEGLWSSR